jgi:hypothetical protein
MQEFAVPVRVTIVVCVGRPNTVNLPIAPRRMSAFRPTREACLCCPGRSVHSYGRRSRLQRLFFAIGVFMDAVPALIILTPVAASHGIDPIHFGILIEANVALGMAHPPVGVCVFAACAVAKLPLERVIRPLLPFLAILIETLLLITYVEGFSMFLPRLLGVTT